MAKLRPSRQTAQARREPRPALTRPRISPRARRVARELGVDALGVAGSGNHGRIVERDIARRRPTTDRFTRGIS